jgi:hypothetical protein
MFYPRVLRLFAYYIAVSFILQDVFLIFQINFASPLALSCKKLRSFTVFASFLAKIAFLYKQQLSDSAPIGHIASRKSVLPCKKIPHEPQKEPMRDKNG